MCTPFQTGYLHLRRTKWVNECGVFHISHRNDVVLHSLIVWFVIVPMDWLIDWTEKIRVVKCNGIWIGIRWNQLVIHILIYNDWSSNRSQQNAWQDTKYKYAQSQKLYILYKYLKGIAISTVLTWILHRVKNLLAYSNGTGLSSVDFIEKVKNHAYLVLIWSRLGMIDRRVWLSWKSAGLIIPRSWVRASQPAFFLSHLFTLLFMEPTRDLGTVILTKSITNKEELVGKMLPDGNSVETNGTTYNR